MVAAYGMHGKCTRFFLLFDLMQKEGIGPDVNLHFDSLICSHSGTINEGIRAFRSTGDFIVPREEHYGCMLDLLSRAGQLEEAYNLVKCQPSSLSSSALGSLLAACRVHGNTEMGELIGRRFLELEYENSTAYAMVSNLKYVCRGWKVGRCSPSKNHGEGGRFQKDSWVWSNKSYVIRCVRCEALLDHLYIEI